MRVNQKKHPTQNPSNPEDTCRANYSDDLLTKTGYLTRSSRSAPGRIIAIQLGTNSDVGDRGADGLAGGILHPAIQLHAVPRLIGNHGFRGIDSAVPFRPGGIAYLPVIPLVAQARTTVLLLGCSVMQRTGLTLITAKEELQILPEESFTLQ